MKCKYMHSFIRSSGKSKEKNKKESKSEWYLVVKATKL